MCTITEIFALIVSKASSLDWLNIMRLLWSKFPRYKTFFIHFSGLDSYYPEQLVFAHFRVILFAPSFNSQSSSQEIETFYL